MSKKNTNIALRFVGTDAYLMHKFLPYMGWKWKLKIIVLRFFLKLVDRFLACKIYVDHENLIDYLREAGFKNEAAECKDPVWYPTKFEKNPQEGFNILYYDPSERKKNKKSIRWLYGVDIVEQLKEELKHIDKIGWLKVDGTADMEEVWPITDFYLRPNRSDGASRMRQEAEINNIPFYHSRRNPSKQAAKKEILKKVTEKLDKL